MRHIKLIIAVLAFLVSSAISIYGQESRPETAPAAVPEVKPDAGQQPSEVKSDAGQQPSHEAKPGQATALGEKRYVATVGANGVQEVAIIGGSYYFDPNYIVVKVNVPVELTIMKEKGYVPHDITVKAPDAGIDFKIDMSDKKPQKVKFTPTKVGKYEISCDKKLLFFKSHKDRGMKGTIEVVP